MADNTEKIEEIEALLDTGATAVKVDGHEVALDQAALRKRRMELAGADSDMRARRPRIMSIDLSGSF